MPRLITLLVLIAAMTSALAAPPAQGDDFSYGRSVPPPPTGLPGLTAAAAEFLSLGQEDYQKAVGRLAPMFAHDQFKLWDRKIWRDTDAFFGWSYFLSTAVPLLGNAKSSKPVVAFYSPWSDVFLLTQWDLNQTRLQFFDAELATGDYIRTKGAGPFEHAPLWLRSAEFKIEHLAAALTQSQQAFQALFPESGAAESFRSILPKPPMTELNLRMVANHLTGGLLQIAALRTARDYKNAPFAAIRKTQEAVIKDLSQGKLWRVLDAAADTDPGAAAAVKNLPPGALTKLAAAALLFQPGSGLVFAIPLNGSDLTLVLQLQQIAGKMRLRKLSYLPLLQDNAFAAEVYAQRRAGRVRVLWAGLQAAANTPNSPSYLETLKGGGAFLRRLEEAGALARQFNLPLANAAQSPALVLSGILGEVPFSLGTSAVPALTYQAPPPQTAQTPTPAATAAGAPAVSTDTAAPADSTTVSEVDVPAQ